ncbi:hypothetical protein BGZ95_001396 [Linnemannia exigua]|uniref:LisH domain-containing protein n=1 Tax=Linnemannia exigua TaxID=604196 RepID=A0AAD4H4Z6_9FUNG|nr:hypothetical protein BGZ95_001396 [Linnemannia exigua]
MPDLPADGTAAAGAGTNTQTTTTTTTEQQPAQQQQQAAPAQTPQTQQEVDRIVLNYLNQKGYKQAEIALKREANLLTLEEQAASLAAKEKEANAAAATPGAAAQPTHDKNEMGDPDAYDQAYSSLRRWIENYLCVWWFEGAETSGSNRRGRHRR